MKAFWIGVMVAGLVTGHLTLVMAYAFPGRIVPAKVRAIAGAYVRPLFHQEWKLFAPDPPLCSCELQWSTTGTEWRSIGTDHYLEERMAQNLARYAQASLTTTDQASLPQLIEALGEMVADGTTTDPIFRIVEECVIDARDPAKREIKITPIDP
ncbi:MAG: DUF5819 family protein [Bacteroidota bacterium]|nr:DUF5819 family protein [Bacteroidota bacterium]